MPEGMIRGTLLLLATLLGASAQTLAPGSFTTSNGVYQLPQLGKLVISSNSAAVDWGRGFKPVKPFELKSGWFAHCQEPGTVWLWDGKWLELLPRERSAPTNQTWFWYVRVPKEVLDRLPANERQRYSDPHKKSFGFTNP
jgi:hypothetical protein